MYLLNKISNRAFEILDCLIPVFLLIIMTTLTVLFAVLTFMLTNLIVK